MDDERKVLLIRLVENNPRLWDIKHTDYKKVNDKQIYWSIIAETLDVDVEIVKSEYYKLRSSFFRILRRQKQNNKQSEWKFFPLMTFLMSQPDPNNKKVIVNVPDLSITEENYTPEDFAYDDKLTLDYKFDEPTYEIDHTASATPLDDNSGDENDLVVMNSTKGKMESDKLHNDNTSSSEKGYKEQDNDRIFAEFLYLEFRKLDGFLKDEVKLKIHRLLVEEKKRFHSKNQM
ncbi:DgyrCDS13684 [Dimorphilus gyrociliatus]|uniref:DgyrCDS13684 n=1 Tax=Dimorphilus gyrociliatus TaxID=2664684 RepID=A0A7I8WBE5_9ANNE|nr:DgyrCDS13684 [Dimorphilus gyrociliatus]